MKAILITLFLLTATGLFATDHIPGFMDVYLATGRYYDRSSSGNHVISSSEVKITYGVEYKWVRPYAFAGWKTFFDPDGYNVTRNFPYRDLYDFGIGIEFKRFFFISWHHRCSHGVVTDDGNYGNYYAANFALFEGWPTMSYDMVIVGIKVHID